MPEVAIKLIPTILIVIAIPVVFSPRILPLNTKQAPVTANASPIIHRARDDLFAKFNLFKSILLN